MALLRVYVKEGITNTDEPLYYKRREIMAAISREGVLRALQACSMVQGVHHLPPKDEKDPLFSVLVEVSPEDEEGYLSWYHSRHRNQPPRIHRGIVGLEYLGLDKVDHSIFVALNRAFWQSLTESFGDPQDIHIDLYIVTVGWRENDCLLERADLNSEYFKEQYLKMA